MLALIPVLIFESIEYFKGYFNYTEVSYDVVPLSLLIPRNDQRANLSGVSWNMYQETATIISQ